jgi:hypothetical protein
MKVAYNALYILTKFHILNASDLSAVKCKVGFLSSMLRGYF